MGHALHADLARLIAAIHKKYQGRITGERVIPARQARFAASPNSRDNLSTFFTVHRLPGSSETRLARSLDFLGLDRLRCPRLGPGNV